MITWSRKIGLFIGFLVVCCGMINITPGLPGLPPIGDFPTQYFRPWMFGLFMAAVVLTHPFGTSKWFKRYPWMGVIIDIAFVLTVTVFVLAYLDQKETVDFKLFPEQLVEENQKIISDKDAELISAMGLDTFNDTETLDAETPGSWVLIAFLSGIFFSFFTMSGYGDSQWSLFLSYLWDMYC